MKTEILQRPDHALVRVTFEGQGEQVVAESGAMVARDAGVEMKTALRGGLWASAKRKLLGGESLFVNTFTATAPGRELYLAGAAEGDTVEHRLVPGEPLYVHSGAFLASSATVKLDTKWGGAKGFFGPGLFLLKAEGEGTILLAAYGAIHPVDVSGEGFICDNHHIVAFTSGLQYDLRKVAGLKSLFLSGEGLVCHFRGQGRVWLQTRSPGGLAGWVHPFRRVKTRSSN
jgi:uncharacterized protein (TIGR00266 family)